MQGDISIIGGGVIGKTAALCLAHAGLEVMLLQQDSPVPVRGDDWDLRVYALNHQAREVLTQARAWHALDAARIAAVDAMEVNGERSAAGQLNFDSYGARTEALAWIVEDANLNQALDAALKFSSVKQVRGQATALVVEDGQAILKLADGGSLSARLAVGADGADSWVRGQCDIGIDYRSYGQQAVVANFECEKPHRHIAFQWFGAGEGIVALLPLPGQRVSLVWSAPEALARELLALPREELAQRVAAWSAGRLGALRPLGEGKAKSFPLRLLRPHELTAPRVALVGDAAHVVHPLAGHGMNLGFGDVAALCEAIAGREPHRDCGDARVLSRYARMRKEDILLMQLATDGLERLFGIDAEPFRTARNMGLAMVDRLPFLKRRLIGHAIGK